MQHPGRPIFVACTALLLAARAAPAAPQDTPAEDKSAVPASQDSQTKERPGVDDLARDAATQPLVDTNLKKRAIPAELEAIQANPYSLDGIGRCAQVNAAIVELDGVLGPDVDAADATTRGDRRRRAGGEIAKSVVGGLIPFRGVVREISGAGEAQRRYHAAIEAGLIRRAFLKGYGKARNCKPPIAPGAVVKPDDEASSAPSTATR